MEPSQACAELVKRFEGLRLEAYLCPAGLPTIGYGHTSGVKIGDVIDQDEADRLLAEDLASSARAVDSAVHVPISQQQFDALVSFAFNCRGWRGSTLLKLLNADDLDGAAAEFPKWCHAGKDVLRGLVARRDAEQHLFSS